MISWPELNHLNALVKIASDVLMLLYQKLEKCSKTVYGALL